MFMRIDGKVSKMELSTFTIFIVHFLWHVSKEFENFSLVTSYSVPN